MLVRTPVLLSRDCFRIAMLHTPERNGQRRNSDPVRWIALRPRSPVVSLQLFRSPTRLSPTLLTRPQAPPRPASSSGRVRPPFGTGGALPVCSRLVGLVVHAPSDRVDKPQHYPFLVQQADPP